MADRENDDTDKVNNREENNKSLDKEGDKSLDKGDSLNKSQGSVKKEDDDDNLPSNRSDKRANKKQESKLAANKKAISKILEKAYDARDNLEDDADAVKLLRQIETDIDVRFDDRLARKFKLPAKLDVDDIIQDLEALIEEPEEDDRKDSKDAKDDGKDSEEIHPVDFHQESLEKIFKKFYKDGEKRTNADEDDFIYEVTELLNVQFTDNDMNNFRLPQDFDEEELLKAVKDMFNASTDTSAEIKKETTKFDRFPRIMVRNEQQIGEAFKDYIIGKHNKMLVDDLPGLLGDVLNITEISIEKPADRDDCINSVFQDVKTYFETQQEAQKTKDKFLDSKSKNANDSKRKVDSDDSDDSDDKTANNNKKKAEPVIADRIDFLEFQNIFHVWFERNHDSLGVPQLEEEEENDQYDNQNNGSRQGNGSDGQSNDEDGDAGMTEKELLRRQLLRNIDEYENIYDQKLIRGEDTTATRKILETLNQQMEDLDKPDEDLVEKEDNKPKKKLSYEDRERRTLKGFKEIFTFYSRQHMMGVGKSSFDQISDCYKSILLGDYLKFIRDFDIEIPYVKRGDMMIVFQQAAGDNRRMEFEEFVDSFNKLAEMVVLKAIQTANEEDDDEDDPIPDVEEIRQQIMGKIDPLRPSNYRKRMQGHVLPFGSQTSINARIPKDSLSYKYIPKKHTGRSHDEKLAYMKDREEKSKKVVVAKKETEMDAFKTKRSALLRPIKNPVMDRERNVDDRKAKIRRSYKTLRDRKLEEDERKKVTLKGLSNLDYNDIVKGEREDDAFKPLDLIDSDDEDDEALNYYKIDVPTTNANINASTNISKINTERKKPNHKQSKSVDKHRYLSKNSSVPQLSMGDNNSIRGSDQLVAHSEMVSPKHIMDNKAKAGNFSSTGKTTKARGLKKTPAHLRASESNLLDLGGNQPQSVKAKKNFGKRQMNDAMDANSMVNNSRDVSQNLYAGGPGGYDQYYANQNYPGNNNNNNNMGPGYGQGQGMMYNHMGGVPGGYGGQYGGGAGGNGGQGGQGGYNPGFSGSMPGYGGQGGQGGYGGQGGQGGYAGGNASGYPQGNKQNDISSRIRARAGQIDDQMNEKNQNMLRMHDQKMNKRMVAAKKIQT